MSNVKCEIVTSQKEQSSKVQTTFFNGVGGGLASKHLRFSCSDHYITSNPIESDKFLLLIGIFQRGGK
jgi:hypothetical protein